MMQEQTGVDQSRTEIDPDPMLVSVKLRWVGPGLKLADLHVGHTYEAEFQNVASCYAWCEIGAYLDAQLASLELYA